MPAKILVTDDDAAMLKLYKRLFAEADYSVTLAASVAEASTLITTNTYDLLITDYELQDGKGTDLIALFKEKRAKAKTFLVTGSATVDNRPPHAGLDGYFEKPFNVQAFMAAVQQALS
ncbi:MAG: response regulator [Elusimicrobiales bacterium]|nr:response regulator [Elusimicrobiales bacterium]